MRYVEFIGKRENHVIRVDTDRDEKDLASAVEYLKDCGEQFETRVVPPHEVVQGPTIRACDLSDLVSPADR